MFISIGIDCGMAQFLKDNNLRPLSFPFDWTVSYNGISKCIEDNFNNYIPNPNERINTYDIYFHHDFETNNYEDDTNKFKRRIQRLQNILETSEEEIIFCRKGHMFHHHDEHSPRYSEIKNDVHDLEELDIILKTKYPNLKYKIIVILLCGKCFQPNEIIQSKSDKIQIYNLPAMDIKTADELFEKCAKNVFLC